MNVNLPKRGIANEIRSVQIPLIVEAGGKWRRGEHIEILDTLLSSPENTKRNLIHDEFTCHLISTRIFQYLALSISVCYKEFFDIVHS